MTANVQSCQFHIARLEKHSEKNMSTKIEILHLVNLIFFYKNNHFFEIFRRLDFLQESYAFVT